MRNSTTLPEQEEKTPEFHYHRCEEGHGSGVVPSRKVSVIPEGESESSLESA